MRALVLPCCARLPPSATLPHFLAYRDTLAPKNTLANLTTALLETKAVKVFVVAASSSQTTQHSYLQAWLLCVAPNRSQLSHTLSACVTAIISAVLDECDSCTRRATRNNCQHVAITRRPKLGTARRHGCLRRAGRDSARRQARSKTQGLWR